MTVPVTSYTGTVRRSDLEGGVWVLVTDQGVTYQLDGGDRSLLVDGLRVEINGQIAADTMGLAMVGDVLRVKSYRRLA